MPTWLCINMVSLSKKRIENVFLDSLKPIRNGQSPNITRQMLKHGYSKSSAEVQKVVRTKTWEKLKEQYLNNEKALQTLNDLMDRSNKDKNNRLKASIERLHGIYESYFAPYTVYESVDSWNAFCENIQPSFVEDCKSMNIETKIYSEHGTILFLIKYE